MHDRLSCFNLPHPSAIILWSWKIVELMPSSFCPGASHGYGDRLLLYMLVLPDANLWRHHRRQLVGSPQDDLDWNIVGDKSLSGLTFPKAFF
jgi:hypothetical protein